MNSSPDAPAAAIDDEPAPIPSGVAEVGIEDALRYAVQMQQQGRLEGAQTLFQRILEAVPGQPDALCFLGMLRCSLGYNDEGIAMIREAIARVPGFAGFHNNLGNALATCDRLDEAVAAYEQALALDPNAIEACNNLGAIHRAFGRFDQARAQFERATRIDPNSVRSWNNLGLLAAAENDLSGAVRYYLKAMQLGPTGAGSADLLGMTYYMSGLLKEAAEVYRQWLERDPDNPVARHMFAAMSGRDAPARASDEYVEEAFDRFAANFETVLNQRLHYRAPEFCADLLARHLPPPAAALDVLDAGCGTGLCGPLAAPWARDLWGVDLSVGMLEKARAKGVYHHLRKAELTEYLRSTPARWDVVVSADTLCYFGELDEVLQAAAAALRPGGLLVFTVEALADDATDQAAIQPHGRYAHGRAHLDRTLGTAGLVTLEARREVLRHEGPNPVQGWVVAARRPG